MHKNKILQKLLVILLVFTLTSANFALVTESFATSITETIFSGKSDTGHKNVEFFAYFGTEENQETSVISDVNNQALAIQLKLAVNQSGYLKNGKVEFLENEEGAGLNFKLKDNLELSDSVQSLEDNILKLKQINSSSETFISVPIEYEQESYVDDANLSKDAKVLFTGSYIDDNGDEKAISKEVVLHVSWKDEREVKVETEATKYVDFGQGVILQTSVKVDNTTEANALPVKETEVTVKVPKIGEVAPSRITVVPNTTQGTNGKVAEDVIFDDSNWQYNEENESLTIIARNEKQLVNINDNTDEYLKEADEEVVEEERYYSESGIDEYLITYTYENVGIPEEAIVHAKAEAKLTTFSGVEKEQYKNIVTADNESDYKLEGQTGNIVSLNIENETSEVSKAYTYVNYYHPDKYETEYHSKTMINVSHKDIVNSIRVQDVENFYVDKNGNQLANEDLYYKTIVIAKENFVSILGEDGQITILDEAGNTLVTFNKDYATDEAGNFVFHFDTIHSKICITTSAPIAEGNLVVNNVKGMKNSSLDKETFKNISAIGTVAAIKAVYSYVENEVEVATVETRTALIDTTTKVNFIMDRDSLSTLEVNKDVELRMEFNNAVDTSDIYGHSVFEIQMPEYVEAVEVTNANMIYGEGLSITSVEVKDKTIMVTVDGTQDGINSGVLTNGANIVLNTNITVNTFTPATTDTIVMRYTNNEATSYADEGNETINFDYSAPTGLVAANCTWGYNQTGSVLTSVRQGTKTDILDVYAEAKVATMEMVIMNNNKNTVSDVAILGRIAFEGMKDIVTGDALNTTINTKMVSNITADESNHGNFTIYYSSNPEATKELSDTANGWVENPESFENIKSYLIVPADENYIMNAADVLRFHYNYEIPANLAHNESFYSTFATYYTNHADIATTEEISVPDSIGLTTGEGPELAIKVTTEDTTVKEGEEFKFHITVTNTGKETAKNVVISVPSVSNALYESSRFEDETLVEGKQNGIVTFTKSELLVNETIDIDVYFQLSLLDDRADTTNSIIKGVAKVTADDLQATMEAETEEITIEQAEMNVTEESSFDRVFNTGEVLDIGQNYDIYLQVTNLTNRDLKNLKVTRTVAKELDIVSASCEVVTHESTEEMNAIFDETTRNLTWNIDTLEAGDFLGFHMEFRIARLEDGVTKTTIEDKSTASADNTESYESNAFRVTFGRPVLEVTQTTTDNNTYIKEGDMVHYVFSIKNNGGAVARSVELTEKIPEGLIVRKVTTLQNGITSVERASVTGEKTVNLMIEPGEEAIVNVEALAKGLNGVQEKTVTNVGTVSGRNIDEITTNSITHIVEAKEKQTVEGSSLNIPNGTTAGSNLVKTYKLTGSCWLDTNENGMRDTGEEMLTGIAVKLVNSETGVIEKSITTDSKGTYTFAGIKNGNYLVLFEYDTVKYAVTSYHKENVAPNVNSDAISTKIEQDGKMRNGAVTDIITIHDGAMSDIDMGLVLADKFDLKLDKTISKVTVQSNGKTTTDTYDNVTLAKTEIAAKHLTGSTVYVEYSITVSNMGDVAGYAKKIVDYLPEGMTFNSGLEANANWYTGTDGNLYSTALADTELKAGESKTIKLVLTKQLTEKNTGLVNNLAEIYEDYNIYGISDNNSTPANKAQGENDLGLADVFMGVKTGEVFIYVSVIITTILLGSIVIFIAYNKIVLAKRKGGV